MGLKQTTFAGAARILKVSRQRIHQLKAVIALDTRFILIPSDSHKQRILIRLREAEKLSSDKLSNLTVDSFDF